MDAVAGRIAGAVLALAAGSLPAWSIECYTPRPWIPKLVATPLDLDHNLIDDSLDGVAPEQLVDVVALLNRCAEPVDRDRLALFGAAGLRGRYLSTLAIRGVRGADLADLAADPIVAFVERDRGFGMTLDVSNPALKVAVSADYSPLTLADQHPQYDGSDVQVAILDGGVDNEQHESFLAKPALQASCQDPLSPCIVAPTVNDNAGHGTHVAGIAIGQGAPGLGTYQGIAPGAELVDIKVYNSEASGSIEKIQHGMEFILDQQVAWGIDVVNISLGDPLCTPSNGTDAWSELANLLVDAGMVVVASAGNSTNCGSPGPLTLVHAPGAADDVISVANSDDQGTIDRSDDAISVTSLRGPRSSDGDADSADEQKPDLAAPGKSIHSAQHDTVSGYVDFSGTSMAAPHIAGCVARLLDANPALTPLAVKQLLIDAAEDRGAPGWDAEYGHGLADCFLALDQLFPSQTNLGFEVYLCKPGNPPCWKSPDLYPSDPMIVEGAPNAVHAVVTNFGTDVAYAFSVTLGVYNFSNSDMGYPICTVDVDTPLLPGASITVSCDYTPIVSGAPPGQVHACLKAEIVYADDTDFVNNQAQHNIQIAQAASPARFPLRVVNPTPVDLTLDLRDTPVCPCAVGGPPTCPCRGWAFRASENGFRLAADDCPRSVVLELDPIGPDPVPRAEFDVAVVGRDDQGEEHPLLGVTIIGLLPPTGSVTDSLRITGKSVDTTGELLTLEWGASCRNAADYAIYEGRIGEWYGHVRLDCADDGGDRSEIVAASPGNRYYLVVPRRSEDEGSYGQSSAGIERPRATATCVPTQVLGACPTDESIAD